MCGDIQAAIRTMKDEESEHEPRRSAEQRIVGCNQRNAAK